MFLRSLKTLVTVVAVLSFICINLNSGARTNNAKANCYFEEPTERIGIQKVGAPITQIQCEKEGYCYDSNFPNSPFCFSGNKRIPILNNILTGSKTKIIEKGIWSSYSICKKSGSSFIVGFQILKNGNGDIGGVSYICRDFSINQSSDGANPESNITPPSVSDSIRSPKLHCGSNGYATGYKITIERINAENGLTDKIVNLSIFCTSLISFPPGSNYVLQGIKGKSGFFEHEYKCVSGYGLCEARTKGIFIGSASDDVLSNISFKCCKMG